MGRCQQGHSNIAGFVLKSTCQDIFSRVHEQLGKCVTTVYLQCSYALLLCCFTSSLLLCEHSQPEGIEPEAVLYKMSRCLAVWS